MANFTLLEIHVESLSANLPFSGADPGGATEDVADEETDDDEHNGGLALLGVLIVLVAIAAIVKLLSGDDTPDVAIDTDEDEPIDVPVGSDE